LPGAGASVKAKQKCPIVKNVAILEITLPKFEYSGYNVANRAAHQAGLFYYVKIENVQSFIIEQEKNL